VLQAIRSRISDKSSVLDTLDAVGEGIPVCVNGSRIAVGTGDAIVVWDLLTKRRINVIRGSHSQVMGIAITPDSRRVLANCQDGTVLVWRIGAPRFRTIPPRRAPTWVPGSALPAGIAMLPDNRHALRTRPDQALEILDTFSDNEAAVTSFDHMPLSLALSEDGSTVVVGDWAGDVYCFEITRVPATRP
jgi:WD40 repeat protein